MDSFQVNDAELIDQEYMHIYRIMHALFHIDIEDASPYTPEELSIEGV
jgi:hypothetical protein